MLDEGYNREIRSFTQAFGSAALDASALLIPRAGLLAATDARMQLTVEAVKSQLANDGLVYRCRSKDGLPEGEGMFLTCSFWLVDALSLGGRIEEARELFERVSSCANDLGLYSEEVDTGSHGLLGNFPKGSRTWP